MTGELPSLWASALDKIQSADTIAVISHLRPDGDAYGSTLAVGLALQALGKNTLLYNPSGVTSTYSHMPEIGRLIEPPAKKPDIDLIISVDTSSQERLGEAFNSWNRKVDINIDHHASNTNYADINIVDPEVPANAQLLYELFSQACWPITPTIADCLFVGLSTDTGSFKYRGTTARTFQIAAALAEAGARVAELAEKCYASYPLRRLHLQREILQRLELRCHDRLAFFSITQDMYRITGALPEDTEGLIENIIGIQGVELAILFEEKEDRTVKISMRSKGRINVNELCAAVGGGGHASAAGATIRGTLLKAQEDLLPLCIQSVNQLVEADKSR